MNIKFQIIPEDNVLIHKLIGNFDIEYVTRYSKFIVQDPNWNKVEKMLTDIRELNTQKVINNLDIMNEIRRDIYRKEYMNVFLVDTPISTAVSHIYQNTLKTENFRYKYCSTLEHTLKTLDLDYSESYAEELLNSLQNTFVTSK